MKIGLNIGRIEELPEALRPFCEKADDDTISIETDELKTSADVEKVSKALTAERLLRKDSEKKVKSYGEYSPEAVTALEDELVQLKASHVDPMDIKEAKAKLQEIYDGKIAKATEDNLTKVNALQSTLDERDAFITNVKLEKLLVKQIKDVANPSALTDMLPLLASQFRYDKESDEFVNIDGVTPMEETCEAFFKTRSWFVKDSKGVGADSGDKTPATGKAWSKMSMTEQSLAIGADKSKAIQLAKKEGTILNI